MKYSEISPVMRMFMGNRSGFRAAGFSADDLYLQLSRSVELHGTLGCFCVLKTQGKEFFLLCGPVNDESAFMREYDEVCKRQHEISQEDADRIWQESEVYARKVDFLLALQAKGFRIPGNSN